MTRLEAIHAVRDTSDPFGFAEEQNYTLYDLTCQEPVQDKPCLNKVGLYLVPNFENGKPSSPEADYRTFKCEKCGARGNWTHVISQKKVVQDAAPAPLEQEVAKETISESAPKRGIISKLLGRE